MEYTVAKCLCVVLATIIICFDVSLCFPSNVFYHSHDTRQVKAITNIGQVHQSSEPGFIHVLNGNGDISKLHFYLIRYPKFDKVDNSIDAAGQNKDKFSAPMWFGPRLGRKKRTEKLDDYKLADILETLDEYPWTVIAINENNEIDKRGNTHNFTPRLGRTLEESRPSENLEVSERSPPFSPRLGRGHAFSPYSPRLGRDESYV